MTTTETGAASYRVTGRDEDDDKRSTHHRHGRKSRRTQDTGLTRQAGGQGQHQDTKRTKGKEADGQGSAGREDMKKAGATSGLSKDNTVNRHAPRLP